MARTPPNHRRHLLATISCVAFLLSGARITFAADTVNLVTSSAALGSNDTVTWSSLGTDATQISNTFSATTANGKTVNGSFASSTGIVAKVSTTGSWGPASGAFAANDVLVWAFDNAANNGSGGITVTFPSNFGVGAAIQSDVPGQFTAQLQVFNGSTSLGTFTRTSNASGDAIYIGALDATGPNITKAVFSLTSAQNNSNTGSTNADFAIGSLNFHEQPPAFTNGPPPNGNLNVNYSFTYTGTGNPTYSVTVGALPPGLSLSSAGVISGKPTSVGTFTGTVTASNGTPPAATQAFSITITAAPTITSSPPPNGVLNVTYNFTYTGTGSPTYAVTSGNLPTGLSLSSGGVISGKPTATGTFSGIVTASNGTLPNATQAFSITITSPPAITSQPPPGGFVGIAYNFTYAASGTATISYSVTSGALPDGLSLSSAGVISGTPTTAGKFTGVVTATNGTSPDSTQAFSITIVVPSTITSTPPPDGSIGAAYSFTYAVSGTGTFTFSVSSGVLPPGLSLSSAGVITGTPTTVGTFSGVVTATNGTPPNATQSFTINIIMIPPAFSSQPTATPNPAFIGEPVTFANNATGTAPLIFAWDFGDGSTSKLATPKHAYSTPGTFTATLTVTDSANGKVVGTVAVTIGAPLIGTGPDTDGDGIADLVDQTLGVNPADPSTFALSDPTAPPTPLSISKMQIKLNFSKSGSDAISVTGTLPIPAGAKLGGKFVYQVGDFMEILALNSKGQARSATAQFKVMVKAKKGVIAAQTAKFGLKLGHATFAQNLAASGLVNATIQKKVKVPVSFIFNKTLFFKSQALSYTAKAGKSGSAK